MLLEGSIAALERHAQAELSEREQLAWLGRVAYNQDTDASRPLTKRSKESLTDWTCSLEILHHNSDIFRCLFPCRARGERLEERIVLTTILT